MLIAGVCAQHVRMATLVPQVKTVPPLLAVHFAKSVCQAHVSTASKMAMKHVSMAVAAHAHRVVLVMSARALLA